MNRLYCIATAVAAVGLVSLPASDIFAQGTPAGAAAAPAAAAPAPTAAPAATTPPPAATTTTTTAPADKPAATTTEKSGDDKSAKKKKTASKKGQSELDRSIESGTVPSRYKSRIPKEYQGSIPWGR